MNSPLKWHGGKHYLANQINVIMPEHTHYVEPYFGGGSVLFAKEPGKSELVNDLNGQLVNFWRVLQTDFDTFVRQVQCVPLSEPHWTNAHKCLNNGTIVDQAVNFFIDCRQSYSGRCKTFTAITRTRLRNGMNGNASEWLSAVDGLPQIHERLKSVVIKNDPALYVIHTEDTPNTLFYLDPPYLPNTRVSKNEYKYEMSESDHLNLLLKIKQCVGKVMISGYNSGLYNKTLAGWTLYQWDLPNNSASGSVKERRTECLWCNWK